MNVNEQYVYANPARYTISPESAVYGWGGLFGYQGDHRSNTSVVQFLVLMGAVLLMPALFLVYVSTKLRAPSMRVGLNTFDGIGAPRFFRATVGVASIALPVVLAGLVSAAVAAALQVPRSVPLSPLGVIVQGRDLKSALPGMLGAILIAGVVTAVIAVWNVRRKTRTAFAPNFVLRAERGRGLFALAAPAALLALVQIPHLYLPVEVAGVISPLLVLIFLVSIPFMTSVVTSAISWLVLRTAKGVNPIVVGRSLSAASRTTEVVGFAVIVSMALFGVLELFGSFYGQATLDGLRANREVAQTFIVVRAPLQPAWTANTVQNRLADDSLTVLPIDVGGNVGGNPASLGEPTLQGTCEQFKALGATRCDAVSTIADLAGGSRLEAASTFLPDRVRVTTDVPTGPAVRYIVAKRGAGSVNIPVLATKTFGDQLKLSQVGDESAVSAAFMNHQLRWLSAFLWPGMAIFMTGLVLASAESLLGRLTGFTPLTLMTERRTLLWCASGASLLIPLVAAVLSGLVAYVLLGSALATIYEGLRLSARSGLEMGFTGLVSALLGWLVLTWFALKAKPLVGGASFERRLS